VEKLLRFCNCSYQEGKDEAYDEEKTDNIKYISILKHRTGYSKEQKITVYLRQHSMMLSMPLLSAIHFIPLKLVFKLLPMSEAGLSPVNAITLH
jgi:hypothetical protein